MPKQGSKSGKSSKTARVLSLLTDPEAVEDSAPSPESAAEAAKLSDDRRTQANIRGALEQELADAAAPVRPKRPRGAKGDGSADGNESRVPGGIVDPNTGFHIVKETGPLPEFKDDEPMPEPTFSVPVPESEPEPLANALNELRSVRDEKPDEYICFNVTQALVEDKTDKYVKMFGLCPCPRCRIDVIALALSNLPPKYVVAKPDDLIPRLSMYEKRYNAAVVTQVMSACRKVLERPHHERLKKK